MSRNKVILALIAILGLGGLSIHLNKDWFSKQHIQISHRVSPWLTQTRRGRRSTGDDPGNPVTFSLNKYYSFDSLKVYLASEIETNKYAHPIWDMVSDSNSVPTMSFGYGSYVRGMRPTVNNARPDPLQPGVKYRLVLKAGDEIAQHDFSTTPK